MTSLTALERAILETLAYSDIFEYPLRLEEAHRYLPLRAELDEVRAALERSDRVDSKNGYYFLAGHADYVDIRVQRTDASLPAFAWSLRLGRILSCLPFVRMTGLTGSLAMKNLSKGADMDFMLVTQPGRLWIARAVAVTFGRMMRLFGYRICVNLLVSENALLWPQHDLYSAREMCQMIPITGVDVYLRLRAANAWTESILPNATINAPGGSVTRQYDGLRPSWSNLVEYFLRGKFGDRLETWCMEFQLRHIAQRGASDETNFTVDVCQGNFHSHRQWTHEVFQEKLIALDAVLGGEFIEYSSPRTASEANR